jgi:hypothetical protein
MSFLLKRGNEDVDARDKRWHDAAELIRSHWNML